MSIPDSMKQAWKNTKVGKIEDGPYLAKINSVELKPTKKNPEVMMFAWDLVLPDNSHFWHNRVLKDENMLKWAKQDFANLNMQTDDFDLLIENLNKLAGCTINIEIKTNGDFQNAYIKEIVEYFDDSEIPF